MTNEIHVLDHGSILLVETWGSDRRIIEAARMSTDKGFLGWGPIHKDTCPAQLKDVPGHHDAVCNCAPTQGDERLLAYLYNNKHMTPFEMAGMIVEVKAPIFVFREWHRHRTQSYNEMSARYIPLPDENYRPTAARCVPPSTTSSTSRQATGAVSCTPSEEEIQNWLYSLDQACAQAQFVYRKGLLLGIPKELARLPVPVARYSKMRASANLRNWLAFLTLRMDVHAQWEIRQYANAVGYLIQEYFPRTWDLFSKETGHGSK